jgi:lantibiotic modifying enzyme
LQKEPENENSSYDRQYADVSAAIFSELSKDVLWRSSSTPRPAENAGVRDLNLYHGASGLALYFAAHYRASREDQARGMALQTLSPLHTWIEWHADRRGKHITAAAVGGLIGFASCLYGLTNMADWLNAPELLDIGSTLVSLIHPKLIFEDRWLDVMNGSAGTLLALLAFLQASRTHGMDPQTTLGLADTCGRHLLHSRTSGEHAPRGWPRADGVALPGFAHGASGISYALLRLYQETKDEAFSDGALEGFAFERTLYVSEQQGWLDPRSRQIIQRDSWCDGAPGIALGRIGVIRSIDDPALQSDLENSLRITRSLPESADDRLCCGNFGRIDVLHTAGLLLDRLRLSQHARELALHTLRRSSGKTFLFPPQNQQSPDGRFYSSLFMGLAGVGYTLLRLRYPQMLPTVLMLEVAE